MKAVMPLCVLVALIFVFMLLGATINAVSPLLVLWAMRNNLRFFVFFLVCVDALDLTDVTKFIGLFKKFFWINLVMCTVQYFVFGLRADYVGGFFGVTRGCNCYLNVFICIVCAIAIADYFSSKIKAGKLVAYLAAALVMAVFAELKVFYVELVLMVGCVVILSKPSFKTVLISIIFVVCLVLGVVVLAI